MIVRSELSKCIIACLLCVKKQKKEYTTQQFTLTGHSTAGYIFLRVFRTNIRTHGPFFLFLQQKKKNMYIKQEENSETMQKQP
jgi:hypothetical protein